MGADDPAVSRRRIVLLCEDEEPLRELIRVSLGGDYEYLVAGDGRTALDLIGEHRPDLVVLDLMIPIVGGLDVLRALRADPAIAATKVVAVSAWSHLGDEAVQAGADRFFGKPFDPDELRREVAGLLDGP